MANLPIVFVVFGPQGSGKSTQVARLAERQGLKVFEAGKALRERAEHDEKLRQEISVGILVSDEMMRTIVEAFVAENESENGYVFDGYPRDLRQFVGFESLVEQYHWRVAGIFINLTDESAKKRLSTRFEMVNGQKVVRADDTPEIVQKRLNTFKKETLPLKEQFSSHYQLLEIDGEPPVDDVTSLIDTAVDQFLDDRN